MRTFALLPFLSLSLPAMAGPISDKVGDVDDVVLEGTVTVPLYTDSDGNRRPHVLAELPTGEDGDSRSFFFGLATSSNVIVVSDDFVGAAGLKASTQNKKLINLKGEKSAFHLGGEIKTVTIPTLIIGELTLQDVSALVSSSKHALGGVHYDLQIGLGAIPELAWAVSPNKGEVQFALADSDAGRALVTEVGTPIGTSSADWDDPKFGEDNVLASAATLLGPVQLGGVDVTAEIELAYKHSKISSKNPMTSTAHRNEADRHDYWVDGTIGTASVNGWVLATGAFNRGKHPNHQAVVGLNLLNRFQLAANPSSQTMALAPVGDESISWKTQTAERLAQAQATLEEVNAATGEEAAEANGEETDSAEQNKKASPQLVALAHAQAAHGDCASAVESWTQIVETESDNCEHWMKLGQRQLCAGNASAAVESLKKSSDLYRSWWDIDLETRTAVSDYRKLADSKKIKDVFKRMNMDEPAEDMPKAQSGNCHRADGSLAAAHLILGNTDAVTAIYAERLDLDPRLAQVQGNVSIQLGQSQGAHSAYRQAMIREAKPGVASRMGLALAYIADSDWSTAEGHYRKAMAISPNDSILASAWVDAKANADGAEAALKAATDWASSQPGSIAAQYAQLRASWHAGGSSALSTDELKATESSIQYLDGLVSTAHVQGVAARAKVLVGEYDAAIAMAKEIIAEHPSAVEAWLALAEAQSASQEDYSEALAMALTTAPGIPGLSQQILEFPTSPVDEELEGEDAEDASDENPDVDVLQPVP